MTERVVIPLHADTPPGLANVVWWFVIANLAVVSASAVVFGLIPWLSGEKPELDLWTLGQAALLVLVLMVVMIGLLLRRHNRRALASPAASLSLDADVAVLRVGDTPVSCPRDEFVVRPKHAHDSAGNTDYYMGPALELSIGDGSWHVALIDGGRRWSMDPPAVTKLDWILTPEGWAQLLEATDLTAELVSYADTPPPL